MNDRGKGVTEGLAAVVVSFNSRGELGPCLDALLAQRPPVRVIVVDNASSDGSAELVRERFGGRVTLVEPGCNTGFAGGCNRGLAAATGCSVVAFLNPDVIVGPGCLAAAAACLERHPRAGAVAPLLLRPDGETVDSAGQCLARWTLEVRDRGYGRPLADELRREVPVLAACGALAVFRREALDRAALDGAWAEPFFCFWEDLELGWRLNNAGWEVWLCPEAVAAHGRGAGAAAGSGPLRWRRPVELEACILSNRWMTLARHLHGLDLAVRAPVLLAWDLVMTGAGILRRPRLLAALARRLPLVAREWRRRRSLPRRRLKELPC
ncbi:MAG TPA: glycosyltransferase family 2 protein [Acidobacteria bacterium]|nr:glycosyltransferase family 2 protein [Acidobacteriota bacterium]